VGKFIIIVKAKYKGAFQIYAFLFASPCPEPPPTPSERGGEIQER
jgi:hypothetical protein